MVEEITSVESERLDGTGRLRDCLPESKCVDLKLSAIEPKPRIGFILGFQLIAVFNQRFVEFDADRQVLHLVAFLLVAAATGLLMAPAAYHRRPGAISVLHDLINGKPAFPKSPCRLNRSTQHRR